MYKNPKFICVGLEKTGTTWLYKTLQKHPKVFLPPKKEIRFFWEKSFLSNNNIFKRLTSSHFHNRSIRRYLLVSIYFNIRNLLTFNKQTIKRMIWDLKFFFLPHSYYWYSSLFEIYPDLVSGEITALTYSISEEEIISISQNFPNLKIIILLRHPVDRVWSKAKMKLCKLNNKNFEEISKDEWYDVFNEEFDACPSYIDLVDRWKKHFSEDRVHVNYHQKLQADPISFLKEICNFISIDISDFPDHVIQKLDKKIGGGIEKDIPKDFETYLSKLHEKSIKEMSVLFDNSNVD